MPLFINYPKWINPSIFPGVPILENLRWYGLMYVFAFATAYFVFNKQVKEGALTFKDKQTASDEIYSFFLCGIIGLVLGARIFYTLVYDPSRYYWKHPLRIFLPFDEYGNFTGYAGMSYHGGWIGGLTGMLIWCYFKKQPALKWIDVMCVSIPLGFTFGRLGNFLNGELYGRITTVPWGMIFPDAEKYSLSLEWVQKIVDSCEIAVTKGQTLVNLPRHPSQLYEAFFEGIVLWLILWLLRHKKPFDGFFACLYTGGYGFFRFIIEYFREPDSDLGYRIALDPNSPIYFNDSIFNISTGQVLCLAMIFASLLGMLFCYLYSKKCKKVEK